MNSGDRLGPYEILAPIGEGGMGEVYKARDTRLDRIVALKLSKSDFSDRFEREARAVAQLNHPRICQIYDVGPNYLVMEFIEGQPLAGPLPVAKAVEYAAQILDALDAAHRKAITHRDLKPANILVTRQGIKLLDFGLAKQAPIAVGPDDKTVQAALTRRGEILGTLQYMAPEQLQGKDADARSDIFAFGCVLYELISGRRAFDGETTAMIIGAVLHEQPGALSQHPNLDRILQKCLAKDPDQRFQNARDLHYSLTQAATPNAVTAATTTRRRWIPALVALVGVLLFAAGWTIRSWRTPPPEQTVTQFEINPPDGGYFSPGFIAMSPDGRQVAFIAAASGKRGLWLRPLDSVTARLLPGTEEASSPVWSHDSRAIYCNIAGRLVRVELAGGTPQLVLSQRADRGLAVASDGSILVSYNAAGGILLIPPTGGEPRRLTSLAAGEEAHFYPQPLPNGNFLFILRTASLETRGIYASSIANPGQRKKILASNTQAIFSAGHLLWLRDGVLLAQPFDAKRLELTGEPVPIATDVGVVGTRMYVSASRAGNLVLSHSGAANTEFQWFSRGGERIGTIAEAPGGYSLGPDNRSIAYIQSREGGQDIWILDSERKVPRRLSFAGYFSSPIWSPDGKFLLAATANPPQLLRLDIAGSAQPQLLAKDITSPEDWSRDGKFLLYGAKDLMMLPTAADGTPTGKPTTYLQSPFPVGMARFSPHTPPRWVAYTSTESGMQEVYIDSFPTAGRKIRISTGGGRYPQWGPDGSEIYYQGAGNTLMRVALKPAADTVEPAAPETLFTLPGFSFVGIPFQITSDRQRFLIPTAREGTPQTLTVIQNFPALLKNRPIQ